MKKFLIIALAFIGLSANAQTMYEILEPAKSDVDITIEDLAVPIKQTAWNQYVMGTEQVIGAGLLFGGAITIMTIESITVSVIAPAAMIAVSGYLVWKGMENRKIYRQYKRSREKYEYKDLISRAEYLNTKAKHGQMTKEERYELYKLSKKLK